MTFTHGVSGERLHLLPTFLFLGLLLLNNILKQGCCSGTSTNFSLTLISFNSNVFIIHQASVAANDLGPLHTESNVFR